MKKPSNKKTEMSESLVRAQETYRDKMKESGRRKLPGTYMPEDVQAKIEKLEKKHKLKLSEAIWRCIRGYKGS